MTPQELFLKSCRCEAVDRPPVWLMRQAGRHLPEYNALREQHHFLEMLTREELIAEISLQPWRRYKMDAVIVFADILLLPMVMGMELKFLEGQGPKFPQLIASEKDLGALKKFDAARDIPFLLKALRKIKKELAEAGNNEAALIGFAGSPWTVASYITRDFENVRKTNPGLLKKILERLAKETTEYLYAKIGAGCEVLQIFDSWGGVLSAEEYAEWSAPYIKEIVTRLKLQLSARHPTVPIIIYVKESAHLLEPMIATGCDVISVGWETPLAEAKKAVGQFERAAGHAGRNIAIQGNFNPHVLMQSAPDTIREETQKMLETMEGYSGYIANLGHGVLPKTPVENVAAFVQAVIARSETTKQSR